MDRAWIHRGTPVLVVLVMSLIGGLVGAQRGPLMVAPSGLSRVQETALAFLLFSLVRQPEALAQSAQKVYRVGILGRASSPSPFAQQFTMSFVPWATSQAKILCSSTAVPRARTNGLGNW